MSRTATDCPCTEVQRKTRIASSFRDSVWGDTGAQRKSRIHVASSFRDSVWGDTGAQRKTRIASSSRDSVWGDTGAQRKTSIANSSRDSVWGDMWLVQGLCVAYLHVHPPVFLIVLGDWLQDWKPSHIILCR